MPKKEYRTERLILRASRLVTAQQALDYYRRNQSLFTPLDPKRVPGFYNIGYQFLILQQDEVERQSGSALKFWVFTKEEPDRIIGMVSFSNIKHGNVSSTFLAYKLDGASLNKGYITEAIARGIKVVFEELRLNRIEVAVLPRNRPSLRVMEKLGFVREGYSPRFMEINGVWEGHFRFGLVNDPEADWHRLPPHVRCASYSAPKVRLTKLFSKDS